MIRPRPGAGGRPPALRVVGAAIVEGGRCLVAQRGPGMAEAAKWEFPGGKVEPGEDPRQALVRELAEELGIAIEVGELLGQGSAATPAHRVILDVYLARWCGGSVALAEHQAWRWVGPDEVAGLDWAAADLPVLPALVAQLRASAATAPSRRR